MVVTLKHHMVQSPELNLIAAYIVISSQIAMLSVMYIIYDNLTNQNFWLNGTFHFPCISGTQWTLKIILTDLSYCHQQNFLFFKQNFLYLHFSENKVLIIIFKNGNMICNISFRCTTY